MFTGTRFHRLVLLLSLLVIAPHLACAAGGTALADPQVNAQQTALRELVDRVRPAYIFIGGGSGAIISADGFAITNNHVVTNQNDKIDPPKLWRVKTADGRSYLADLIGRAPRTDLVLLKIQGAKNLPFIPLGDSDELTPGERVVAIGNPFALGNGDHIPTVTAGIVSGVGMVGPNAGEVVVTDAPTNPGNSGGPLINQAGQLVGVNYAQMPSRFGIKINTGSGYAISVNQVKRFLDCLHHAKGGVVDIGNLNGVKFQEPATTVPDAADLLDAKAVLRAVEPDSPAGQAGLQAGDRLVKVANWQVLSTGQFFALTARFPAGAPVKMTAERDGAQREVTVTLAQPERVGLGVELEAASASSLKIDRLLPNGPAHLAGIHPGDVIRGLSTIALPTRQTLTDLLTHVRAGQKVVVTVSRNNQMMAFPVELAGESELKRLVQFAATRPEAEPLHRPAGAPTAIPTTAPAADSPENRH